jgi:2-haloacid dehalogenase
VATPFSRTKVCVFDAYGTLFDFNSAVARHRDVVGPRADQLSELWRSKQIQYTWLRSLMGVYDPFWTVTREALDHSMAALGIDGSAIADSLMTAYRSLSAFPEVPAMLDAIAAMGLRTAILSNGDPGMLQDAVRHAGLDGRFEALLSVDDVRIYKVAPPAYQLVLDRLDVAANEVCFLSSNCWDAHGAATFGFDVAWVNRANAPDDRLPGRIAAELRDLAALPDLLRKAQTA